MLVYFLFVIGFVIMIKGADVLVDGSASLAKKFNISNLVIGLTVVAFGTSAPELVVNVIASFSGNTDIAIGNILGSNIANILLILGVSSIIYPLTVHKNTVRKEIPYSLVVAVVLGFLVGDIFIDNAPHAMLTRVDGIILILFFGGFLYYTYRLSKEENESPIDTEIKEMGIGKSIIFVLLGLVGLVLGGNWIVEGAVVIATSLGMSQSFIGLTIVAIGTSLPELATSAVAAYKRNTDIAIGNVVGSNIFNITWILGVSSIINPLVFSAHNIVDLGIVVIVTAILILSIFVGKRYSIRRGEGIIFLILYAAYIVFLIYQG
ncbi:MAG: calcium/sodium antiporter [Ignavibacteriae bacterium]|nr:calcium/sodium antiporter [Ignavibacteriota bacterium]MCB9243845.1 calcium/sodium antiporter [Ignavibacteriales bacterium]